MRLAYQRRRVADVGAALSLSRELAARERMSRSLLEAHQRERVDALVRHAVAHSPFYRERLAGLAGDGPVDLASLPTLDKATMMERYDELVTDRRLRRDELLAHVERLDRDELHLGQYRVMTTSGSSGRKGLFAYDRAAWRGLMAQFLRFNAYVGIRPRMPRRRIAAITGGSPVHMSQRCAATMRVGLHRVLSLTVTTPVPQLVDALNGFQPQFLGVYPSVAALLAEEQARGRLRIAPEGIMTSSELRTPELAARLEEVFGVTPFDLYATTEGLWGSECEHHAGHHLFEDMAVVENVDGEGRPVPPGEPGARLLVTNLFNLAQPLIRLEVADAMTLEPEACPCGRTLVRTRTVDGRSDDVIRLPGAGGATVAIHPLHFGIVGRDREVLQFQAVQEGRAIRLLVVPRGPAPELEARLRTGLLGCLAELGVARPEVAVERREGLDRPPGGKLQMVVAERREPQPA